MFKFLKKNKEYVKGRISVIMPSYLGYYEGCASDREKKFIRAVKSFIIQDWHNKELVIVSDGCDITNRIFYEEKFDENPNIKLVKMRKQKLFSGKVRQKGISSATGEIICYLDTDDMFGKNHLSVIASQMLGSKKYDWVFYNDYIYTDNGLITKYVQLEKGSIGTSSIAHRHELDVSWIGCDKYNHDWLFVDRLLHKSQRFKKIYGTEYHIFHIPDVLDR